MKAIADICWMCIGRMLVVGFLLGLILMLMYIAYKRRRAIPNKIRMKFNHWMGKPILSLVLVTSKQFDPTKFLGEGWTIWKGPIKGDGMHGEEDVDPRSLGIKKIKVSEFIFETSLNADEGSGVEEEKLCRLKEEKPDFTRFGGNVFLGLWEDYEANDENSILEWFYQNFGINRMNFPGLILRGPDGDRHVLCFFRRNDGRWFWACSWLYYQWPDSYPSAGCASKS